MSQYGSISAASVYICMYHITIQLYIFIHIYRYNVFCSLSLRVHLVAGADWSIKYSIETQIYNKQAVPLCTSTEASFILTAGIDWYRFNLSSDLVLLVPHTKRQRYESKTLIKYTCFSFLTLDFYYSWPMSTISKGLVSSSNYLSY